MPTDTPKQPQEQRIGGRTRAEWDRAFGYGGTLRSDVDALLAAAFSAAPTVEPKQPHGFVGCGSTAPTVFCGYGLPKSGCHFMIDTKQGVALCGLPASDPVHAQEECQDPENCAKDGVYQCGCRNRPAPTPEPRLTEEEMREALPHRFLPRASDPTRCLCGRVGESLGNDPAHDAPYPAAAPASDEGRELREAAEALLKSCETPDGLTVPTTVAAVEDLRRALSRPSDPAPSKE